MEQQTVAPSAPRHLYMDLLNILCAFLVVLFHCNQLIYQYAPNAAWYLSVVIRSLTYSAVPVFFMLSGAHLCGYRARYSTKEFFRRRWRRLGIPFLFWYALGILYAAVRGLMSRTPAKLFSEVFNSSYIAAYWFFFPLLALYLAMPVLSLLTENPRWRKYLWYMVALGFATHFVAPVISDAAGILYNSRISFPLTGGFVVPALFGWLVAQTEWKRRHRILLYLSAVLSCVLAVFATIFLSARQGASDLRFFAYTAFPSQLTGAALFVAFRHLPVRASAAAAKHVQTIGSCCLGVWLMHPFVLILLQILLSDRSVHTAPWRYAVAPAVYLVCMGAVYLLKKIPVLRRIV